MTTHDERGNDLQQAILQDRACAWIARLRSDTATDADRQAFAAWLAESPEHARAMDAMLDLWSDLGVLEHRDGQHLAAAQPRDRATSPVSRRWVTSGLALAASLLLAIWLVPQWQASSGSLEPRSYQTGMGERLLAELPDGSRLQLNTDSRIEVHYSTDIRQVALRRGEVFFQVAKDASRPFVVSAGSVDVQALGTAFNVYLTGDAGEVTVTEGVVRVTESKAPASRPARSELLYPNQRLHTRAQDFGEPSKIDPETTLAWRQGKLVAEAMPLADLVRELARYHATPLLVAEPGLAATPVSGVFNLEDLDSILLALEHSVGLRSQRLGNGSIQLISAPL
ncbi:MAG: FecR family protein [Halieaceae bacterium]|jgi:transmembrane sensor|nr:FecR family protein [Halieaceae bacterium]